MQWVAFLLHSQEAVFLSQARSHRNFLAGAACAYCFDPLGFRTLAGESIPFLAGTKCPARNALVHSCLARSSSKVKSISQIRSHVPVDSQARQRRQHVPALPYCRGMSSQREPVRKTYKIPLSASLSSARGRPRVCDPGGSSSFNRCHCSSVTSTSGVCIALDVSGRYGSKYRLDFAACFLAEISSINNIY